HGLPDLSFFPSDDVETGYLGMTGQAGSDPDLGPATCYTWAMEGEIVERAVCAFDNPPPTAEAVKSRLCLSAGVFEIYTLTASDLAAGPPWTWVARLTSPCHGPL